jgi:putative RNA 2'-phosphotransferase
MPKRLLTVSMDLVKLSKVVSHALRHEPQVYGLQLDGEGWVLLSDLASALKVSEADIIKMLEQSAKKRFQIQDGRIRAFYGHSTEEKISKVMSFPPEYLYHGTTKENLSQIAEGGLLPMSRQYVHLSIDEATATIVGNRKRGELVIIKIQAAQAYKDGVPFYQEENGIWLADHVPAKYFL